MKIYINGKLADVTLDTEKTIDDCLTSLIPWIESEGMRFQGLELDKRTIDAEGATAAYARDINSVGEINILVVEGSLCREEIEAVADKLGELPLDLQTGKSQEAAETIIQFTRLMEQIAGQLSRAGEEALLKEYNDLLQQMLAAYKEEDVILLGDLAEYEIAPRLRKLIEE
ncbi:MAG: hypothetical protein LBM77_05085 [Spirochaetaceae bacterium]|jgi:hypothetical protein|nr:hypothetical protein [Spirochaetaceae bacterium]